MSAGEVVRYYDNGWRTGTLDEIKKTLAWIRPTAPIGGAQPRTVEVSIEDLRQIGDNS